MTLSDSKVGDAIVVALPFVAYHAHQYGWDGILTAFNISIKSALWVSKVAGYVAGLNATAGMPPEPLGIVGALVIGFAVIHLVILMPIYLAFVFVAFCEMVANATGRQEGDVQ